MNDRPERSREEEGDRSQRSPSQRRRRPRTVGDLEAPRPQRFGGGSGDGLAHRPTLSMSDVEERIVRADDELADLTAIHMDLAEAAARAEAAWKRHRDIVIVKIVRSQERTGADYREAEAREQLDPITGKPGHELYEEYKITEARAESSARAMRSIEARLSAFQTIASNLRKVAT